jgi:hypothetical protein
VVPSTRIVWILGLLAASPVLYAAGSATPEDAVRALELAYSQKNVDGAVAALDFLEEGRQMLQETNPLAANDPEVIANTARELEQTFRNDVRINGFPDRNKLTCTFVNRAQLAPGLVKLAEHCVSSDGGKSLRNFVVMERDTGWRVVLPSPVF